MRCHSVAGARDIRGELFTNVVLCGGTSLLPGFDERLKEELLKLCPMQFVTPIIKSKIVAPYDRKYLAWVGGSMLASASNFQDMCVSKAEYEECGPAIVHTKCS